jgi:hypothetical protein
VRDDDPLEGMADISAACASQPIDANHWKQWDLTHQKHKPQALGADCNQWRQEGSCIRQNNFSICGNNLATTWFSQ